MGFVIGLSGAAKVGKDTVADYLIQKYGWAGKLSFARNLKNMCKAVFELTEEDVNTQEGKQRQFERPIRLSSSHIGAIMYWMSRTHSDYPVEEANYKYVKCLVGTKLRSPREVLQFVGTDICRALIDTYHIDIVWKDAIKDGVWVVTDVRFPNEAELIAKDLKGAVVKIDREVSDDGSIDRTHNSETAMDSWGGYTDTLDNSKDGLEFLFEEVENFLERNNYKCLTE